MVDNSFELAWCAGIFEAEGSISKPRGAICLKVCMTDRDVICRFRDRMGGRLYGPYAKNRRLPIWQWSVFRKKEAAEILGLFWPYLGERRKEKAISCGYLSPDHAFTLTHAEETAWQAGVFEGEGTICRPNKGSCIRMQMRMTDYDVISRFADIAGGRLLGPYVKNGPHSKLPQWLWHQARRAEVTALLDSFWPYLGERRQSKAIEVGYSPA